MFAAVQTRSVDRY